ncbi:hypothetical protein K501DRAFT_299967 [Backusella circina FSU 941]|nr:hypothetical protein K501DRAFT_299967 [Backusella circina FSU 941]
MLSPYQNQLIPPRMATTHGVLMEEDDNIPLCQFLDKSPTQRMYFPPPLMTSFLNRRPSYPITPSSLLDPHSNDEDEDDEDLVPIAVLQGPTSQRSQYQSAAEKYKEKVKAQLDNNNEGPIQSRPLMASPLAPIPPLLDDDDDDDDLPLSHCFINKA